MTTRSLTLAGGIVFGGVADGTNASVCISEGVISYVGPAQSAPATDDVIDCTGGAVMPGFWNSHVHFFERKWSDAAALPADELQEQLLDFARFGFTSVFDLSSDLANTNALRRRIDSGEVRGPRIFTTGPGLVPPGSLPPDIVNRVMGLMPVSMPMVSAEGSALRAVEANLAGGADAIKVFASGNAPDTSMNAAVMRAAIEYAHSARKPVFVHVNSAEDVETALGCGADIIAHTTPRTPWTQHTHDAIRASNAAMIPTLKIWNDFGRHDRASAVLETNARSTEQLRAWIECGHDVLFGTDYGAADADPRTEYALMQRAGMTFYDALRSLTAAPAARFGDGNARLEPGRAADITVVDGDPLADLTALADVRYTFRNGAMIYGELPSGMRSIRRM